MKYLVGLGLLTLAHAQSFFDYTQPDGTTIQLNCDIDYHIKTAMCGRKLVTNVTNCVVPHATPVAAGGTQYVTCEGEYVGGGVVNCQDPSTWVPEFECTEVTSGDVSDTSAKNSFVSSLQNIGKKLKKDSYADANARKQALKSAKADRRTQLEAQIGRVSGINWWEAVISDNIDFEGYTDKVLSKRRGRPIKYRLATVDADIIIDANSGGLDSIDLDVDGREVQVRVDGEAGKVKIVRNNEDSYTLTCNNQNTSTLVIGDEYNCKGRVWDIGSLTTDTGCVANAADDGNGCQCNTGYTNISSVCVCAENYHVVNNECVQCVTDYVNDAGDVPSGNNTVCDLDTDGDGIADIDDGDDDNDVCNSDNMDAVQYITLQCCDRCV